MSKERKTRSFTGWQTVLSFTLSRHLTSKSYIALTLIFAILFFVGMSALMIIPNLLYTPDTGMAGENISQVILCDPDSLTGGVGWLEIEGSPYHKVKFTSASGVEEAVSACDSRTLILAVDNESGTLNFSVISPEDSELSDNDISLFVSYVNAAYRSHLLEVSGIDPAVISRIYEPVETYDPDDMIEPDQEESEIDEARKVATMIFSYLLIFIIYMMVVMYGQGAASSVILEKTSKLMDFFLVSVKPAAMILGKVLATAIAAFIQVISWGLGALLGFLSGRIFVSAFVATPSPDYNEIINMLDGLDGLFSIPGIVISLLMIIFGFLLYCSIAAIGGAMASKPEDLSSTNLIFTLCIVVSFLLSINAGSDGMVSTAKWLIYFPFTAILVTPGRALSGQITLLEGGISLILVAVLAFLGIILAGKVYKMMSFYRGDPPKPAKIFAMLRDAMKNNGSRDSGV